MGDEEAFHELQHVSLEEFRTFTHMWLSQVNISSRRSSRRVECNNRLPLPITLDPANV